MRVASVLSRKDSSHYVSIITSCIAGCTATNWALLQLSRRSVKIHNCDFVLLLILTHICIYTTGYFVGVTFSLIGYVSIPTDGSGRVLITDINPNGDNDEDALICRSEIDTFTTNFGNWYLHPTEISTDDGDRINPDNNGNSDRGWLRNRGLDSGHRLVRLRRRDSATALEGVLTCDIIGDNNTPRALGIHYPSESLYIRMYNNNIQLGSKVIYVAISQSSIKLIDKVVDVYHRSIAIHNHTFWRYCCIY